MLFRNLGVNPHYYTPSRPIYVLNYNSVFQIINEMILNKAALTFLPVVLNISAMLLLLFLILFAIIHLVSYNTKY